ncbi:MAG: hypothetical protein QM784_28170 [Polyangiaceae bacterium]
MGPSECVSVARVLSIYTAGLGAGLAVREDSKETSDALIGVGIGVGAVGLLMELILMPSPEEMLAANARRVLFKFGSSASGIDYCPKTKTLVLGSYSGFLHFLKPSELDPNGIGFRPLKELKRWCFLKNREPFQW